MLKLYVWEGVLTDYTPGLVVVLAHDVEEARRMAREGTGVFSFKADDETDDFDAEPKVVDPATSAPVMFFVPGGG